MVRSAYALGGLGSGLCEDKKKLIDTVTRVISFGNSLFLACIYNSLPIIITHYSYILRHCNFG